MLPVIVRACTVRHVRSEEQKGALIAPGPCILHRTAPPAVLIRKVIGVGACKVIQVFSAIGALAETGIVSEQAIAIVAVLPPSLQIGCAPRRRSAKGYLVVPLAAGVVENPILT
jgi:hypothetical protein